MDPKLNPLETYWDGLSVAQRAELAESLGSSVAYLRLLCKGASGRRRATKRASLGFAMAFTAASGDVVSLDDIPLCEDAQRQLEVLRAHPVLS